MSSEEHRQKNILETEKQSFGGFLQNIAKQKTINFPQVTLTSIVFMHILCNFLRVFLGVLVVVLVGNWFPYIFLSGVIILFIHYLFHFFVFFSMLIGLAGGFHVCIFPSSLSFSFLSFLYLESIQGWQLSIASKSLKETINRKMNDTLNQKSKSQA